MISRARQAAFRILLRVETEGAWASELLARTPDLSSADAGLATTIVMGSLRRQAQLDYILTANGGLKLTKLDREVQVSLRMGVYQLLFLDRVPAHAIISESVELVKRARKSSAAGLVNAVLRRVPRASVTWPTRDVRLSVPSWLLRSWDAQFGQENADRIAAAFLDPPETWLRRPPQDRTDLEVEPVPEVPGAWRLLSGVPNGLRLQDLGAQTVVPLLELEPGMTFLDLCAAPGNKTAQALETEGIFAVASDLHPHRLAEVEGCARVVLDATCPLPFGRRFDRILVDAPCTGTGTLGRNPEIRWKLRPQDVEELHARQVLILRNAMEALRPGGRLVYATCSLERRENAEVVAACGLNPLLEHQRIPGIDAGDGFYAAVIEA